jgi:hypothetical protein
MAVFFWSAFPVAITSPPAAGVRRFPGRLYLWLGIALVVLGPVLSFIQLQAKILKTPWYVPSLATIGVALLLLSLARKVTVSRSIALILCGLLMGAEWYFLVSLSKLPAYTGPVSVGTSFPTFTTTLADGTAFNQDNLRGEQNTALVFFRGRW